LVVSSLYLLCRRALAVAALRFRSREFKELGRLLGRGLMRVIACSWLRPAGC